jgi:hypothetical protein
MTNPPPQVPLFRGPGEWLVQKPEVLTTFGWSDYLNDIHLYNYDLTPAKDDQFIPAKSGQGHRLFQLIPGATLR